MTHVNDERLDDYLDGIDATDTASDFHWFPPSYDEWNAIRAATGRPCGTFNQYLDELSRAGIRQSYDALTYFGAIDDDDCVPTEES